MQVKPVSLNTPTWRWDIITSMVEHNEQMLRSQTDQWLRRGFFFRRRYENAKAQERFMQLRTQHPDIYGAYELYMDWSSERWLVEAAIVANVPVEEISSFVGQTKEIVSAYEALFYDIRTRLDSKGYVLNRIFLPAVQRGLHERDYDLMMKSLAYFHGWEMAKEMVGTGVLSDTARRWMQNAFNDNVLRKGFQAINRLEVNNYNAVEVAHLVLKLREIEVTKGSSAANDEALKTFGQLLEACSTSVLGIYDRDSGGQALLDEPRAAELLGAAEPVKFVKVTEEKPT